MGWSRILVALSLVSMSWAHAWGQETELAPTREMPYRATVTGQGPPLILVPALGSSIAAWDGMVAHLKDRYECHVLAVAGYADLEPVAGLTLEDMKDGLARYIREKKLEKPLVMGHVLGGHLAMWLAATEPGLVGPVISIDGYPYASGVDGNTFEPAEIRKMLEDGLTERLKMPKDEYEREMRRISMQAAREGGDQARIGSWYLKSDMPTMMRLFVDQATHDIRADLKKVEVPVMLVATNWSLQLDTKPRDLEKARRRCEAILAGVANRTIVVNPRTRAYVMLDEPEWLLNRVDEFLAKVK